MIQRARIPATPRSFVSALACLAVAAGAARPAAAQDDLLASEGYLAPPDEIREALLAPWHRNVELDGLDPAGRAFVIEEYGRRMPALADFAKRHHVLGGLQVDALASRSRELTIRGADRFRLLSWRDGREVEVPAPDGARVGTPRWAPDGSRLAFFAHFVDATHIYVADPATGRSRRLTRTPVLATLVTSFAWSGDGRSIFAVLVPEGRGPEPVEPAVATTPHIWVAPSEENRLRTFPSLLETPHEFTLLEYYTVGQLARIDVADGRVRMIGAPAMIDEIDPSPDGRYIRVRTIQEPYSDLVPVGQFATVDELWDLDGDVVAEIASRPVRDGAEDDDEEDENPRRLVAWRPDGQGLSFVQRPPRRERDETADDADGSERPGASGDRILQWLPPFGDDDARVVHETENRIRDVAYSDDAGLLFVTERDGDEEMLYAVRLDGSGTTHTIYRYDTDDFHADPGDLLTRPGAAGRPVVRLSEDGGSVYLSGTRYHEDPLVNAPQPFVDRVALATGVNTRIFESAADRYERVVAALDDDLGQVVLSRESRTEVPNFYVRDLATGRERRLTENRDYTPDLTRAERHIVEVERADGVTFWTRITLPADRAPDARLPALFWFYPREYEDEASYDESNRAYNRNRFPALGPRSMELLVRRGWAVVEPDVPIIGPDERWNDQYIAHLRNSLAAAIDALDRRGWIDRARLAIGGHSYGGYGTLNALIHTPFFKAGIAGAANSNRTLTPSGFQRESRMLWENRDVYIRMSPIFWLNELSGALLMYHGLEDQNVGTFPINSTRTFHALNALGKTTALYMYPYEGHGPRAEETMLDLWARWIAWLDEHVGRAGAAERRVAERVTASDR